MLRRHCHKVFVAGSSSLVRFSSTTPAAAPAAAATPAVAAVAAAPAAVAAAVASAFAPAKKVAAVKDFSSKVLGSGRLWKKVDHGHVSVYIDSGMFAWIVMDRQNSSANALGKDFVESCKKAMDTVDEMVKNKEVRVAIITSAKDTFCVGADLEQLYPVTDMTIAEAASREGQEFFTRIEKSTYPIVAAINGTALGGGCELALACHHRLIASEKAALGLPETLLGLLPGAGGTVRLQKLVGTQTALKWILQGGAQKPDRCRKAKAVDAVIESSDRFTNENRFFEGVRSWCGKLIDRPLRPAKGKKKGMFDKMLENTAPGRSMILSQSLKTLNKMTKGKYLGQYAALECVLFASANPAEAAYKKEAKKFAQLMVTPEAKNQCSLYFLENGTKMLKEKTGMAKEDIPTITSAGVIGAGVMGAGIVHYFANKNISCAVKDIDQARVDAGIKLVKKDFELAVKKKKLDKKGLEKKMKLVTGSTSSEVFRDVQVIVEAAVEIMSVKKKIVEELEKEGILDGKKLYATNTSSLSLTELQSVSKYPQNIVGMHFFNPVSKMPLVEVIKGKHTSKEAVATIYNLALKTGKKPIIVGDAPGFLVNRILGVYMAEAGRLAIDDRADPNKVDEVILNFGMPMGPFRLLDEVGLDVASHVGPVLENGLKSKRFAVSGNINQMVKDGFLGKKNGKGFYRYDEKGKEQGMNTAIANKYLCSAPDTSFSPQEILDRCMLLMVNEATMILEEGVAATAEDIDVGMVWGTGFAPFRGGLMQYADHRGSKNIVDTLEKLAAKTQSDRFKPSKMLVEMAKENKRFFPNRPFVPYQERSGFPAVTL